MGPWAQISMNETQHEYKKRAQFSISHGLMDPRAQRTMGQWVHGPIIPHDHGPTGPWAQTTTGLGAPWAHEFIGPWAHKFHGLHGHRSPRAHGPRVPACPYARWPTPSEENDWTHGISCIPWAHGPMGPAAHGPMGPWAINPWAHGPTPWAMCSVGP